MITGFKIQELEKEADFFPPDEQAVPDYGLDEKYSLNKDVPNVCRGYVCKYFGEFSVFKM